MFISKMHTEVPKRGNLASRAAYVVGIAPTAERATLQVGARGSVNAMRGRDVMCGGVGAACFPERLSGLLAGRHTWLAH